MLVYMLPMSNAVPLQSFCEIVVLKIQDVSD